MAISGKDLLKMSNEEIKNYFSIDREKCPICKVNPVPIDFDEKGERIGYMADGKWCCPDCHFEAMGNEIEKHPIYNPASHIE